MTQTKGINAYIISTDVQSHVKVLEQVQIDYRVKLMNHSENKAPKYVSSRK